MQPKTLTAIEAEHDERKNLRVHCILLRYRTVAIYANKAGMITRYDARTLVRSLCMGGMLCTLSYGIMAATGGEMSSLGERLGQLFVICPLLGAVGALLANSQARRRGESLALAASGVHPSRACAGALAGVVMIGMAGATMLWAGVGELDGLFPRVEHTQWTWLPSQGQWEMEGGGVRVNAEGLTLRQGARPRAPWIVPREPVGATVAWMTLVLVDWVREEIGGWQRLALAVLSGGIGIAAFHLVGANQVCSWMLLVIPLPLLIQAWTQRTRRRLGC
ncbi:MAG: hypothetical protein CSA75_00555 [Sorangium cellulosum]|nr:MAG: hypothetical protein CSA75_00555 [Sorangium cellulosum]